VDFEGAAQLGLAVARHPDLLGCLALNLYRHTLGRAEQDPELVASDELTAAAEAGGGRLRPLVVALVTHPAFRTAQPPTAPCTDDEAGQTRACDASCGPGVEVCVDGTWTGCDAPPAPGEACDGVDQDCDGVADAVVQACDGGLAVCVDGEPGACELPPAPAPACDDGHVTAVADSACGDPDSAACADVLDAACAPCGAPAAGIVDVDGAWRRVACAAEAP